jgi:siderophore synthetase component
VAADRVVVLGEADDAHRPQQSIRTLGNASGPRRCSLKLALGIVNTSTARTLAPHTLANGPAVTTWLRGILADDPVLRDELRTGLLGEVLTASYRGPAPALPTGPDGDLGCLWREAVAAHLAPGERAVPFTTLAQRTPNGTPWVAPWVRAHGPARWAARFTEVAVTPVAHLLWAHGVALEAHAQNLLLVHRHGWPERLVVRDLHDGIRFARQHLPEPERVPPLAATPAAHLRVNRNSFIEFIDDVADGIDTTGGVGPDEARRRAADEAADTVRDFVADAFLFVNLAEVAFVLADDLGVDEATFWGMVRGVLDRHGRRSPELAAGAARFDLCAPTIGIEQLTTRRLLPDDRLRVVAAPNPLAGAHPPAGRRP